MFTKAKQHKRKKSHTREFVELALLLLAAILFRSLLYELYVVPSGSMLPTLLEGDRIIVKKYYYGISKHSFPFSPPLFKGRVFEFHKPQRGDIVVFETDKVYIKRLVGLPGDKIQMIYGKLYINGEQLPQTQGTNFRYKDKYSIPRYTETFPNGKKHSVLNLDDEADFDNTGIYHVPQGSYFFIGDNRDDSRDSRDLSGPIGFVGLENIMGKVDRVAFSSKTLEWYNIPGMLINIRKDGFWKGLE
jgi:signal peptidase I